MQETIIRGNTDINWHRSLQCISRWLTKVSSVFSRLNSPRSSAYFQLFIMNMHDHTLVLKNDMRMMWKSSRNTGVWWKDVECPSLRDWTWHSQPGPVTWHQGVSEKLTKITSYFGESVWKYNVTSFCFLSLGNITAWYHCVISQRNITA